MVSADAPCASPNAMSAAEVARQAIDDAGFMSVPPARDSRPRPASFLAPAYHALARREGRGGRRVADESGRSSYCSGGSGAGGANGAFAMRRSAIGALAVAAIATMRIEPARTDAGPVPMIAALAPAVAASALDRIDRIDGSAHALPERLSLGRHQRCAQCRSTHDCNGYHELAHDSLPSMLARPTHDIPDRRGGNCRYRVTATASMP